MYVFSRLNFGSTFRVSPESDNVSREIIHLCGLVIIVCVVKGECLRNSRKISITSIVRMAPTPWKNYSQGVKIQQKRSQKIPDLLFMEGGMRKLLCYGDSNTWGHDIAQRVLLEVKELDRNYDAQTAHGRSEGLWSVTD